MTDRPNIAFPSAVARVLRGDKAARPDRAGRSSQGLDAALANFGRLSKSTAQRVVRFWQVRQDQ
jgi:hypothetical protein